MAQAKFNLLEKSGATVKEKEKDTDENEDSPLIPECAVCLQPCIHPARLPCSHIFCYLCVKGVANQSKRCPMCRQEIPTDFLEKPQLVELDETQKDTESVDEEYQWFYEGRNGWWQYDQRTSLELETAYKQGKRTCELLIAGFLYIADFGSMLQLRRNDPSRRRRIKRDLHNVPKKGVAGLRLNSQEEEQIVREIRGAERPASPASDNIDICLQAPEMVQTHRYLRVIRPKHQLVELLVVTPRLSPIGRTRGRTRSIKSWNKCVR